MTYDAEKLFVERIYDSALLGYTMRLGESQLGDTTSSRQRLSVSACTVSLGYSVGQDGELSLDPPSATIGFADWVKGPITSTAPIRPGDGVEITYDGSLVFKGYATSVTVNIENGDAFSRGKSYTRSWSASLSGIEGLLLSDTVSWSLLPEESAIERLRRWFTVDTTSVPASHMSRLETIQFEEENAASSLLELARTFTAVTQVPVRLLDPSTSARKLEIVDDALDWRDDPLTPRPGFTDASTWVTSVDFVDGEPDSASIKGDDMRFITFRVPDNVTVYGVTRPVARITHNFGHLHYVANIEFAPRIRA